MRPRPATGNTADTRPLVMIVEPDDDFRTILGVIFEHQGLESAATADPDEALRWVRDRQPAVVVGEHPLPLADGRLLCCALHDDPLTASIPFVAVTSVAFPENLAAAAHTHRHGVFAKPIEPRRILQHVQSLLPPTEPRR